MAIEKLTCELSAGISEIICEYLRETFLERKADIYAPPGIETTDGLERSVRISTFQSNTRINHYSELYQTFPDFYSVARNHPQQHSFQLRQVMWYLLPRATFVTLISPGLLLMPFQGFQLLACSL